MKKAKQPSKKAVWDALKKDYTTPTYYTIKAMDAAAFAKYCFEHPALLTIDKMYFGGTKC